MSQDLSLLIKLIGMTTSSNDGEALVAIRKANIHVRDKLKTTWDQILRGKVTIIEDPFEKAPMPQQHRTQASPPPPPRQRQAPMSPPPGWPQPQRTRPTPRPQPASPPPNNIGAAAVAKAQQPRRARRNNPINIDDLI